MSNARPEKRRRRIDEIGDESRRRLLNAAEELFAEKGFERTSFMDIAARSGISHGSIPWHFHNKHGMLMAVVERVIDRYISTDAPEPEKLTMADMVAELRGLMVSEPKGLFFMLLTEAMSTEGHVHEQYVTFFRSRRELFSRWLSRRAGGAPFGSADAAAISVLINGAILGVQMQWYLDPESVDLDRSLTLLATLVDGLSPTALATAGGSQGRRPARKRTSA